MVGSWAGRSRGHDACTARRRLAQGWPGGRGDALRGQDLVETLPLALLGRQPFLPAKLPIRPEHHYRAQLVFLPVFGVGSWLLMGGAAHGLLRLAGERSDLRRVLDVIGTGMLIPMPPLWLCDMALIAADRFRLPELAFVNPTVQLTLTKRDIPRMCIVVICHSPKGG